MGREEGRRRLKEGTHDYDGCMHKRSVVSSTGIGAFVSMHSDGVGPVM